MHLLVAGWLLPSEWDPDSLLVLLLWHVEGMWEVLFAHGREEVENMKLLNICCFNCDRSLAAVGFSFGAAHLRYRS